MSSRELSQTAGSALDHESEEGRIAAFDAWSERKKHELGPFAGISFHRMNPPTIGWSFSRHWPHLLCWQWALWVIINRPLYDGPPRFWWSPGYGGNGNWRLKLWWVEISWHSQNYDRIANTGRRWRADAPVIYVHSREDRDY